MAPHDCHPRHLPLLLLPGTVLDQVWSVAHDTCPCLPVIHDHPRMFPERDVRRDRLSDGHADHPRPIADVGTPTSAGPRLMCHVRLHGAVLLQLQHLHHGGIGHAPGQVQHSHTLNIVNTLLTLWLSIVRLPSSMSATSWHLSFCLKTIVTTFRRYSGWIAFTSLSTYYIGCINDICTILFSSSHELK